MSGNVLDYIAKGVNSNYGESFVNGLRSGQESAALRQKMEEALRVRNALQRAAEYAQSGNYKGAAGSLFEGGEASSGVNLLTSSDPNMQSNRESYFAPMIVQDKNGKDVLVQPSNKNNVRQLNDYGVSPRWDYGQDQYGNSYQRPKQGGAGAGPTPGMPQYAPGVPEATKEAAKTKAEIDAKTQAEAARDLPAATSRYDYTVQAVDNLMKHPGLQRQTGLKGRVLGWLDPQERLDFEAQAQRVNGQTLMSQMDMLKALRPVSNEESQNTAKAAVNLDAYQNPKQYLEGLKYYKEFLARNQGILRQQAQPKQGSGGGGQASVEQETALLRQSKRFQTNPDAAIAKFANRTKMSVDEARKMLGM